MPNHIAIGTRVELTNPPISEKHSSIGEIFQILDEAKGTYSIRTEAGFVTRNINEFRVLDR